jgi:hypothetical protein
MNWTMSPRIKSRIGTATAAGALMAISALIVPTQAFGTPTPLNAADYATEATTLFCQTNHTNIPTTNTEASDKPDTRSNSTDWSWADYDDD